MISWTIWIVCGIISWGGVLAQIDHEYRGMNSRERYTFALFVAMFGPIGLLAHLFLGAFFQHGFKWK